MRHWIFPLFKKGTGSKWENYRGIHLTVQLSKVAERVLAHIFIVPLSKNVPIFGINQFAYTQERGCRDMIAFLILSWLIEFSRGRRVAFYRSDVTAAFDRVDSFLLLQKLSKIQIHKKFYDVMRSWLRARKANIILSGTKSDEIFMENMVFQGTVLGPLLWNIFFEGAGKVIRDNGFLDIIFADDLNGMRSFPSHCCNAYLLNELKSMQKKLHLWGEAHRVIFDAAKESFHIMSRSKPHGDNFRLLGITFDPKLSMYSAIHECVGAINWKLQTLLRTLRFHNDRGIIQIFKSHLLSFIEYRTVAISHCSPSSLELVNDILTRLIVRS